MTLLVLACVTVSAAILAASAALLVADRRRPRYVGRHRAMF